MTSATLECRVCGKKVVLLPPKKGHHARVSLVGSAGWGFDTDNGWRCPDHVDTPAKISTRRAIEVVLSRVRLNGPARDALAHHLAVTIRGEGPETDPADPDTVRAAMQMAYSDLSGIDMDFTKRQMLSRIELAREKINALS